MWCHSCQRVDVQCSTGFPQLLITDTPCSPLFVPGPPLICMCRRAWHWWQQVRCYCHRCVDVQRPFQHTNMSTHTLSWLPLCPLSAPVHLCRRARHWWQQVWCNCCQRADVQRRRRHNTAADQQRGRCTHPAHQGRQGCLPHRRARS